MHYSSVYMLLYEIEDKETIRKDLFQAAAEWFGGARGGADAETDSLRKKFNALCCNLFLPSEDYNSDDDDDEDADLHERRNGRVTPAEMPQSQVRAHAW
jgi:hypothetical protein